LALSQPDGEGPETETTAEDQPEALDTDELARQVYAVVRRRLAVERERARGRT
jgi:hypothetical protein